MVSELSLRPAIAADRAPVLAFCQQTWSWGDYVEQVWDNWLADGGLRVGEVGGEVVALGKLTMQSPHEAWIEGLRVAESLRGRGFSYDLINDLSQIAQVKGARTLRLATGVENLPMHRTASNLGFRAAARFSFYEANGKLSLEEVTVNPDELAEYRLLLPIDEATAWQRISESPIYEAVSGLYSEGWSWTGLDRDKLKAHLARRQVVARIDEADGQGRPYFLHALAGAANWRTLTPDEASVEPDAIRSLAIISAVNAEEGLEVGYVDCTGEGDEIAAEYELLATTLRLAAASLTPPRVILMLADQPGIIAGFSRAGYGRDPLEGSTLVVFERSLVED